MKSEQVLSGVWHIQDDLGVCMTLLCGSKRALLVDTGYGTADVRAYVRTLTDLPLTVILTHAHHDHALGARWFEAVYLFEADHPHWATYTGETQRLRAGVPVEAIWPDPLPLLEGTVDLGGLTAQVIHCPGHTPGSAVVYVPERELLLTSDNWNPCTWLFFPEALGAEEYRRNVQALLKLPFAHVLCAHQHRLYERAAFEQFVAGLTDECLLAARKVDMGWPMDTREAHPAPGQIFVFDFSKTSFFKENEA